MSQSNSSNNAATLPLLLARRFVRLWFVRGLDDKILHPLRFLLKSGREVVRTVFKKNDETESKEYEKNEPEQPA